MMERSLEHLEPGIRRVMAAHRLPGLALGLLLDGEAHVAAYGIANAETGRPVTPGTLFQIGSISKVFTATALMPLVERGDIDLDRPVRAYLPEFRVADPAATEAITLAHLLSHTGGFDGNIYIDVGPGDDALAQDVALLAGARQRAEPGALWHYANGGFSVAARILEVRHGTVFEEVMRRELLAPLELRRTCLDAAGAILHAVAAGHQAGGDGWRVARPWAMPRQAGPAGGIATSAGDLLRFARAHLGDGERLARMSEPRIQADPGRRWGLGWWLREIDGVRVAGHNGLTHGFTSQLTLVPARGAAFALLANRDEAVAAIHEIEAMLFAELLGLGWWEPPAVTLPPDELAAYAGRYRDGELVYRAAVAGNRLLVERDDGPPFALVPVGGDGFRGEGAEFERKYGDILRGPDGRPRLLRFIGLLAEREEAGAAEIGERGGTVGGARDDDPG